MNNSEWDNNAFKRYEQVITGLDITFHKVFLPLWKEVVNQLPQPLKENVLEVGCGTGVLSKQLSYKVKKIVCIEPSANMIDIAKKHNQEISNIEFHQSSIDEFHTKELFTTCISHMAFHNISDITNAFRRVKGLLKPNGLFIFSIPHPCFFHFYKNIELHSFNYNDIESYELEFTISLDRRPLPNKITYFHRRLSDYVNELSKNGFSVVGMKEPYPSPEIMIKYPEKWEYPRYILISALSM